jgi:hypothetical protein
MATFRSAAKSIGANVTYKGWVGKVCALAFTLSSLLFLDHSAEPCCGGVHIASGDKSDDKSVQGGGMLTKEECRFIRSVIYEQGIHTHVRTTGVSMPRREVVIKQEMLELYKKDRSGTIRLLLSIVRGGRPDDALAAGVTALALEEGPVYALCLLDETTASFDKAEADDVPTKRDRIIKDLEEMLSRLEKKD